MFVSGKVGPYTKSIYARTVSENGNNILLREVFRGGLYFNLTNGTIGSVYTTAPDAYDITDFGNGWYRCSVTFTISNLTADFIVYTADADGLGGLIKDMEQEVYYIWGAQFEDNISYRNILHTHRSGSTVTRNQDCMHGMEVV